MPSIPHISFPFRIENGKVATVEQDSQAEVNDCIRAVLSTRLGSRVEEPEYGIADELFELLPPNPNVDGVLASIEEWEPRVKVMGSAEVDELTKTVLIEAGWIGD